MGKYFSSLLGDYLNKKSLYHEFYGFLATEAELNYFEKTAGTLDRRLMKLHKHD
jgi:hypothetical protein